MTSPRELILSYLSGSEDPSLEQFVLENAQQIPALTTNPDFRSQWASWFGCIARELGKKSKIGEPNWNKISPVLPSHISSASPATISPTSASQASTSSSSSSCLTVKLTVEQKKECEELYESIKPDNKWVLSTKKIVEDNMFQHAKKCEYHHPSHSVIFDPKDSCWTDYFTEAELEEIKKENMVKLDPLPTDLNEYLKSYIGKHTKEDLFDHHNAKLFHPIKKADLHWAQKIITEALDLYFYNFFPIVDQSEADIIHRVWHCIEKCYDESNIKVRSEERVSLASSNQLNGKREIKGTEKMGHKQIGRKTDLLFTYKQQEYGCAESGAKGDKNSLKAVREGNLKLPRVLKDMLRELLIESPTKLRETKVAGFLTSGLLLSLVVMDSPKGSVTRISRIGPLAYPDAPDVFSKKIIPILSLIWQVKSLMKNAIKTIRLDDTITTLSFDDPSPCLIPQSITLLKSRKRKLDDDE